MAEAFKNAYKDVTTSYSAIYTCPASTEAVVKSLLITNVDGSNSATQLKHLLQVQLKYLQIHELIYVQTV